MRYLILDLETLPVENVRDFVRKEDMKAPTNYTKPESIAKFIEEEYPAKLKAAALDLDLARVCAIGGIWTSVPDANATCVMDDAEERKALTALAEGLDLHGHDPACIITFNGHKFDLPLLMRRARYLGVDFPRINLDRYRSPHIDLYEELTMRGAIKAHGLRWYMRRLGWTDLLEADPLKDGGADVGQAAAEGRWDQIAAHVRVDVLGTYRLAQWMGVIPKDSLL